MGAGALPWSEVVNDPAPTDVNGWYNLEYEITDFLGAHVTDFRGDTWIVVVTTGETQWGPRIRELDAFGEYAWASTPDVFETVYQKLYSLYSDPTGPDPFLGPLWDAIDNLSAAFQGTEDELRNAYCALYNMAEELTINDTHSLPLSDALCQFASTHDIDQSQCNPTSPPTMAPTLE
jgi:hypothetical protein